MTDYDRDRGAYTPSGEAPLAFDPRSPGGGAGRPPTTLIVSVLILLVLVAGVFVYYRSGVRHLGQPPVVGQPLGDIKQAPPASSQPTDEAAGLSIYKAEESPGAVQAPPQFAPPPEQPQPLPVAPPARAPAPAAAAPVLKGPASPTPPTRVTAAPSATPEAAASAPNATPARSPVPAAPARSGGPLVQIGAFSSPALADKGWNDVARLLPGDMVGRTQSVEPVSKDGQTLYRTYIGGFSSKASAQALCNALKAQGHSCFVK